MHRVYCAEIPPAGEIAEIDAREKEHIFKVFRATPGDAVELLDGRGTTASGVVEAGRVIRVNAVTHHAEPELKLFLCCALPRKQKLDQLLKQATELGAWSIQPVRCIRSVAEGDPKERWEVLLREACKQSGNPFVPELLPEKKLPEVLQRLQQENIEIYYGDVVPDGKRPVAENNKRALLIGPEGGFAPEEISAMKSAGAKAFNFSPYILRLETAAVCGLTALRMLGIFLAVAIAGFFASGCSQNDAVVKNPLMLKAAKLRDSGDSAAARRYFRQAVAKYPEAPECYLALAQLCDEELDDPLEALYCYRNFLQLTPESSREHQEVKRIVAALEKRLMNSAEVEKYSSENEKLRDRCRKLERRMIQQQLTLNKVYKELEQYKKKGKK